MSTETSKFQIETGVDPSGIQDGMQAVEQAVIKTERTVTDSSARTGKAIGAIGDHAAKGADKADKSLGNLTASIQRYNAQLESGGQKGAKYFESLADSRGLDKTNEAFQAAIAKARELETQSQKLGVSAAQTAAAMRGVPAQFTDIITSLQGGQAPMTVLLQQGGQLKDMFGGAGNAAKALGGYVMGLVNPLTVTAAGAATLAYALYAGGKESREFAQTLLVTGNQAGVTSGQLMAMAAAVSAVSGTQGNAADVLNQLAATGKVTSANLQQAAQAAVQFEKAGGQAAGETVKAFAELGKAPLEASLKLNESMGYLTKSTYAQIKALMDQGRETEAASVAQKAFADALSNRSGEMVKNLGLVEKSWAGIKSAVTGAWDAIKSIGREVGVEGQASATSTAISRLEAQIASRRQGGYNTQLQDAELAKLKERQSVLQSDERLLRAAAGLQAEQVRLTKATAEWDKEGEKYLSKQAQMQRDITKARGEGLAAQRSQADIEARVAAIREKYKETGTGQDAGEAALAKQKATLEEAKQYAINLQRELAAVMAGDTSGFAKQTQAEKTAIELQAQLATGIKGVARANMEKQLAVALDTVEVEKSNRVTEKQIQIQKDLEKQRAAELKALGADAVAIQAKADALNAELGVRGKSKAAIEEGVLARLKENATDAAMFDNSGDVVAAINAKAKAQEAYVKALKATDYKSFNEHTDELLRSAQEQQKLYQDELQLSGLTAVERAKIVAQRAIELKYAKELDALDKSSLSDDQKETQRLKLHEAKRTESAAATGKVIQAEYDRVSQQIEQSLTDALMRGFESGKGFAQNLRDTVANMFRTLVLRPIVSAIVSPVAGAITGGLGLSGAANAAMGAASGAGLIGSSIGALGTGLGAGAGMIAGGGIGGWLSASTSLIGTGTAAGVMAGLGALAGPIGAVLAIGSLLKGLDTSGTYHTGGASTYSAATGASNINAMTLGTASVVDSAQTQAMTTGMVQAIVGILDSTATTFGKSAGYQAATAFADDSSKDSSWGALVISKGGNTLLDWAATQTDRWAPKTFADGQAGAQQYASAVAVSIRDLLITQTPDWADTMLTALGDAPTIDQLAATVAQINATQAALVTMGDAAASFASLGESASAALIKALGGAQTAVDLLGSYYTNFYSDAERQAVTTKQLMASLGDLGVASLPATRAEYRALIDAATTAGNTDLAAGLIKLSGAFATITTDATAAADSVETAADALKKLQNSALKGLEAAVSREKQIYQAQADAASGIAATMRDLFDLLGTNIRELRDDALAPALTAAQGSQAIAQALATARGTGYLPEQDALATAISAARGGLDANNFASVADQRFEQLRLAGQLTELQSFAGQQLTAAEQAQKTASDQLTALDKSLEYWQQQIDIAQGTYTATLSVADAIAAVRDTLASQGQSGKPAGTNPGGGPSFGPGGGGSAAAEAAKYRRVVSLGTAGVGYENITDASVIDRLDSLAGIYHSYDGTGDLAGLAAAIRDAGGTVEDLSNLSGYYESDWEKALATIGVPAFAAGGKHTGGWAVVGERGPELAYMPPAQIYTAPQTSQLLGANNAELLAEMRAMRAALEAAQAHNEALLQQAQRTANATNGQPERPMLVETAT